MSSIAPAPTFGKSYSQRSPPPAQPWPSMRLAAARWLPQFWGAMEQVAKTSLTSYSRYGSPIRKQVYIYGMLDPSPKVIDGPIGMSWNVGGWLMTWFYQRLADADVQRLHRRAIDELATTFRSRYTAEIGLAEVLAPDVIRAYAKRATGEKYLVVPQRDL